MLIAGQRILIIEDMTSISLYMAMGLEREGATVHQAHEGKMGLKFMAKALDREQPYDMALVDLGLPDMDGLQLIKGCRSLSPTTTVLVLSADDRENTKIKSLIAGADDFLEKPIDMDDLKTVIREQLNSGSHEMERGLSPCKRAEARLREGYMAHLKTLRQQIEKPLPLQHLKSLIHQIKGSAALYGLDDLSLEAASCSQLLHNAPPDVAHQAQNRFLKALNIYCKA